MQDINASVEFQLMLRILNGISKPPATKESFIDFCENQSDAALVEFFDAVMLYSARYEAFLKQVYNKEPVDGSVMPHAVFGAKWVSEEETKNQDLLAKSQSSGDNLEACKKAFQQLKECYPGGTTIQALLLESCSTEKDLDRFCAKASHQIATHFIISSAQNPVNITYKLKEGIIQKLGEKQYSPTIFSDAVDFILRKLYSERMIKFYSKVVLSNIGEGEIHMRWIIFLTGTTVFWTMLVILWTVGLHQSSFYRFFTYPFIYWMFAGYIQYNNRFCVTHASFGTRNMSPDLSRALKEFHVTTDTCVMMITKDYGEALYRRCLVFTITTFLIVLALPPYHYS
ncbi:hypothetical protein EDD86DRAFT_244101 [Gorgonomyces haynaldii]|nr:hypothetical protein EDD86DRAFT_244101 [Gorgonomyces haynaldii]